MSLNIQKNWTTWIAQFDAKFSVAQKIGFGYVIAIGLGFTGTIAGLIVADYLQGQGVEQLVDAQQQTRLLTRFHDSATQIRMGGLHLAVLVDHKKQFKSEYLQLLAELETARTVVLELEAFLASDPVWLAVDKDTLVTLFNRYMLHLEAYIDALTQLGQSLEVIHTPQGSPAKMISQTEMVLISEAKELWTNAELQKAILALDQTETVTQLKFEQDQLAEMIHLARLQELEGGKDMEAAQGIEKLIIVVSAIAATTVAGIIAWRTTQAIVQPLQQVQATANTVIQNTDFSLKLPVMSQDEVGLVAQSFNQLLEWVNEYTQALNQTVDDLKKAQSQLIQTEKMSSLGQMVAGITHEINNPLTFITGNLSCIDRYVQDLLALQRLYQQHFPIPPAEIAKAIAALDLDFLEKDHPQLLSSMELGADRIYEMMMSLQNFSRMDESELKRVDIHEGLESTLFLLNHRLNAYGDRSPIKVVKNYGDLPEIQCYPGQLNQVFMHILSNALDAIENDSTSSERISTGEIFSTHQIMLRTFVWDTEWAKIEITDNGCGIPTAIQHQIFDPFFTTKPVGQGTGLGLSISYRIVTDLHGGQLQCLPDPQNGTRFIIQIPLILPESRRSWPSDAKI